MTLTLELSAEEERDLAARAAARNMGLADYIRLVLREAARSRANGSAGETDRPEGPPTDRADFESLLRRMAVETGVSLTDEQTRRESLYEDAP